MCFAEKVLNNNIQQEDATMGRTTVIILGSGGAQGGLRSPLTAAGDTGTPDFHPSALSPPCPLTAEGETPFQSGVQENEDVIFPVKTHRPHPPPGSCARTQVQNPSGGASSWNTTGSPHSPAADLPTGRCGEWMRVTDPGLAAGPVWPHRAPSPHPARLDVPLGGTSPNSAHPLCRGCVPPALSTPPCPPTRYGEDPTPTHMQVALFGNMVFAGVIRLR